MQCLGCLEPNKLVSSLLYWVDREIVLERCPVREDRVSEQTWRPVLRTANQTTDDLQHPRENLSPGQEREAEVNPENQPNTFDFCRSSWLDIERQAQNPVLSEQRKQEVKDDELRSELSSLRWSELWLGPAWEASKQMHWLSETWDE